MSARIELIKQRLALVKDSHIIRMVPNHTDVEIVDDLGNVAARIMEADPEWYSFVCHAPSDIEWLVDKLLGTIHALDSIRLLGNDDARFISEEALKSLDHEPEATVTTPDVPVEDRDSLDE
jgi:hypothetical protein